MSKQVEIKDLYEEKEALVQKVEYLESRQFLLERIIKKLYKKEDLTQKQLHEYIRIGTRRK